MRVIVQAFFVLLVLGVTSAYAGSAWYTDEQECSCEYEECC